jgi:hypothetical protein
LNIVCCYHTCYSLIDRQSLSEYSYIVPKIPHFDRVGGSSRDISPIVKEFKEKLEQESSLSVSERTSHGRELNSRPVSSKAEVNISDKDEEDFIDTNPVTANLERVDKEAQLIAARKIVATAYYEKTQQFNLPGLQEEVNQALSEVDAIAHSQDETLSPKGMLNWLKGRQKQPQY